jgi:hypothetical protein
VRRGSSISEYLFSARILHVSASPWGVATTSPVTFCVGAYSTAQQPHKHLFDLVNRKRLGIKIVADPVEHFFGPFVVGVVEGHQWTHELAIRADSICGTR